PPIRTAPDLRGVFPATVQVPRDIGAQGAVRLEPELAVGPQAVRGDMSDGHSESRGAGGPQRDERHGHPDALVTVCGRDGNVDARNAPAETQGRRGDGLPLPLTQVKTEGASLRQTAIPEKGKK